LRDEPDRSANLRTRRWEQVGESVDGIDAVVEQTGTYSPRVSTTCSRRPAHAEISSPFLLRAVRLYGQLSARDLIPPRTASRLVTSLVARMKPPRVFVYG
jgi:hypothetical protein